VFVIRYLKAQRTQTRMIIRPSPYRPSKKPLCLLNRHIIDACMPPLHQSLLVELPVLISIRSIPLPCDIVTLIAKPYGNSVRIKCPQLLDQPVLQLSSPLSSQKLHNLLSPCKKLRPVTPNAVYRIRQRNALRITRIPSILGSTNLQNGSLPCKRRHKR
jgi:hypothetical protein